nr:response regulator [Streptomyces sp. CB01883]
MPGVSGRVLVVDDNKVIRQLIRVNLELEGLEVVTAADGAECLDVVHQVRPDLVTLDVVMPRLDGLRTAARLRADPRTHHLPLAIISACTQYEVETGLDVGVDAFLAKPFEPAELVRLVKDLIGRRDGHQQDGQGREGHRRRGPGGAGPDAEAAGGGDDDGGAHSDGDGVRRDGDGVRRDVDSVRHDVDGVPDEVPFGS